MEIHKKGQRTDKNANNTIVGIIAVVVLIGAIAGTIVLNSEADNSGKLSNNSSSTSSENKKSPSSESAEQDGSIPSKPTEPETSSSNDAGSANTTPQSSGYKDGTYSASGRYRSPGGNEEISISITVSSGNITDSAVTPSATSRESRKYQNDFAENYKNLVLGKALDELSLGKVSGSSLTSRGFNEAINLIREQAKI